MVKPSTKSIVFILKYFSKLVTLLKSLKTKYFVELTHRNELTNRKKIYMKNANQLKGPCPSFVSTSYPPTHPAPKKGSGYYIPKSSTPELLSKRQTAL